MASVLSGEHECLSDSYLPYFHFPYQLLCVMNLPWMMRFSAHFPTKASKLFEDVQNGV